MVCYHFLHTHPFILILLILFIFSFNLSKIKLAQPLYNWKMTIKMIFHLFLVTSFIFLYRGVDIARINDFFHRRIYCELHWTILEWKYESYVKNIQLLRFCLWEKNVNTFIISWATHHGIAIACHSDLHGIFRVFIITYVRCSLTAQEYIYSHSFFFKNHEFSVIK